MRVLLVEDSGTARVLLQAMFRAAGCDVTPVQTGQDALVACRARCFDLIILDRELPDLAGEEVVRSIRATRGPNRVTAVFGLSATVTREAVDACRRAGMLDLLLKPLKPDELKRILRYALKPVMA